MKSDSILRNAFNTFFKALFGVVGVAFGIILVMAFFTGMASGGPEVPHTTSLRVLPDDQWQLERFSHDAPIILNVNISGVIGLDHLRKEDIFQELIESQEGPLKPGQVKGVVVTINTPGGTADDSDAIYRMLLEYKKRYNVPVIAYVEGLCASGGMYIACAADKVYASEDSLIGHVGVLLSPPFFNFSKLMGRLGIESKTFSAGKDKDDMNPFRPWNENEGQNYQRLVTFMYDRFVNIVAEHRPMLSVEALKEEGAQIYPAPQAETLGYIDGRMTSIDDVLKDFATDLGIYDNYQYIELQRRNFFEELFGAQASMLFEKKNEWRLSLPGDLHPDLYGKPLYLYHPQ